MSTAIKWIIALIVLAALAWLLWWSGWLTGPKAAPAASNIATTTPATNTPPAPTNGMSASNDASNAALAQDTAAIDAQMVAYTTDSNNVDSSMNDKQVAQ